MSTDWSQVVTAQPPARAWAGMAYDSQRSRVILFGGDPAGDFTPPALNDTWEFNPGASTWTQITTTGAPSTRLGFGMCYDSTRHKVILFGGTHDGFSTGLTDTWEYDPNTTTWTQITTSGEPAAGRQFFGMVYDANRQRVVMFGGWDDNNGRINETWEYNPGTATWAQITTTGAPSARDDFPMIYDSARHTCVLFGGTDDGVNALGDTWEYDGGTSTWTQTSSTGPHGRIDGIMAYDSDRALSVLFGGNSGADPAYDDTWEYNGATATWTQATPATSPPGRYAGAMSYVSSILKTVLFSGDDAAQKPIDDTWEYAQLAPTVTSFTPTSGPVGTPVTITGDSFTGATSVDFNGTAVASFTVVDDQHITTTVPAGATTGPVSVTTPYGTGTSASDFTVTTTPPTPPSTSGGPLTVQMNPNAVVQAAIIPDATEFNDGMMTAYMVRQLNALWDSMGAVLALNLPAKIRFDSNVLATTLVVIPTATSTMDGAMTKEQVQQLNALWATSGLSIPVPPNTPVFLKFPVNVTCPQAVDLPVATADQNGVMSAEQFLKLQQLSSGGSQNTASLNSPSVVVPVPPRADQFYVELDGVFGFSNADLSRSMAISGAADPLFNTAPSGVTVYTVYQVLDSTRIIMFGATGTIRPIPPDANNGHISWQKL